MSTAGAFYAHAQSSLFGHTTRPSLDDDNGHRRTSSSSFGTGGSTTDSQFLKSDSRFFAGVGSDINGVDPTSVSSKWPLETVMRLRRLFELWGSVEVPTPQCLFHLLAVAGALPPQWTTIDGERQGQYFTDAFFDSDDTSSSGGAGAPDPSAAATRSSGGFAGIAGSKPSPSGNVGRGAGESSAKSATVKVKKINSIPEALNRVRAINVVLIAEELFDAFPADAFWLQFPDLLPDHLSTAADPSGESQPSSQNAAEQALSAAATIPSGGKGMSNPAGSRNIGGKGTPSTQHGDKNIGGKGKSAPVASFDGPTGTARAAPTAKSTVNPTGNAAALFLFWAQRCGAVEGPLLFSAATKVVTLTECVSVSALAFAIGARYTESQSQPQQSAQLAKSQQTGTPTLGFVGASAPASTLSTFFDSHKIDRATFRMKAARALLMPPPSSPTTMTAPHNVGAVGSGVVATSAAGLVTVRKTELSLGTTRRLAASLAVVAAKSRFHRSPILHESNSEEPALHSFGVRGDDVKTFFSSTGRDGGHEEDATGTDVVGPPPEFMVPWYGVTDVPVEVFCAASDGGEMDFFPATVKRVVVSVCDPTALQNTAGSTTIASPFSSAFEGGLPPISFNTKQASTALGGQNDNSTGVKTTRRMELRTRVGTESGGKASTDDAAKSPAGVCLCWTERTQASGTAPSTAASRSRSTAAPARAAPSSGFSTARALRPLPPVVLEIAFAPTVRTLVAETCLPTLSSFTIAPEPSHSETPNPSKDDDESARGGVRTRRAHAAAQAEEVQKITQAVAAKRAQQTTVVKHFAFYSGLASGAPPMRQPVAVRMSAGTRDSRDVAASDFGQGVVRVLTTAAKRVLALSSTFATAKSSSAPKSVISGSAPRAGDQKSATEEEAEVVAATATAQTAAGALATWAAALSQFLPPPPSGRAGGANSGGGRASHLTTTTHTQHHTDTTTTTPSRKPEDGKRTRSGQRGRPPGSGVTSATPSAGAHAAGGLESASGSHPIPHGTVKFGIAAEATALAVHCAAQSAILASKCGLGTSTSSADQQGKSQQPRPARKGSKHATSSAAENDLAADAFIPDEHSIYARMSAVEFATRAEATAGYALALQPHTVGSSVFAGWAVVLATHFDRKGNRAFSSSTSSPTGDQGRYADSGSVSGGGGGGGGAGAGAMSFEPIQALLQHQRIPAQLPPIVWRFTDALRAEMLLGTSSKSGDSTGGAGSDAAAKSSRAPQPNPASEKSSQGGKKSAATTATNDEVDETDRQRSAGVAKASGRRRGRAKASFHADENDATGDGDGQEEKEKKKTRGRPPASSADATPSRPTRALTLGASSEKKNADSDSAAGTPTLTDKKATKGKSAPSSAPATGGDAVKRSASLESARLNSRGVTPSPAPDQEPRRGTGRMSLDERRRLAQEDAMRTEDEDMSSRFATLRKRNRDLSSGDDRGAGGLGDRPSRQSSTSRLDRELEPRRSPAPQVHAARDSSTGTTPRRGLLKEELKDEKGVDLKSIEPHRSVRGSVGASATPTSMPAPAPAMTASLFRHAPKPKVGPMVAPVVPAKKIPVRRFDDANALGLWVAGETFASVV